ncbi:peroxisome assembly protein 12 [Hydra vulgaris]|uniref:Peroxisome assembly protein 12 n=1 Tax=Hydra vulgaris TaxID=6087 RepID=A0ABM4DET1_HYDVU
MAFKLTSSKCASLFDVTAEESLRLSLKPAWAYFCNVLTMRYPVLLKSLLKHSDEIFAMLLMVLEEYSFRRNSGTVTECFYQLKRECSLPENSFRFRHVKWISLISVVLLPYISDKLQNYYDKLLANSNLGLELTSFQKYFLNLYPILLTFIKWIRVINYIQYLFNYTCHPSPILRMAGIQLKYGVQTVVKPSDINSKKKSGMFQKLHSIPDFTASIVMKIAPLIFYSLQFVDMFYDKETGVSKLTTSLPFPSAPLMPKVASTTLRLPPSAKQCPLCQLPHTNPTTIVSSGFVFCYACLYRYIEKHKCCPITYRPCEFTDMIRIHN